MDEEYEGGWLEWRAGGRVVAAEFYDPAKVTETMPIPKLVRDLLKQGEPITWGIVPRKGRESWTTTRLETPAPELMARLRVLDRELGAGSTFLLHLLRAQLLRDAGFESAALVEVETALAEQPEEPHAVALAFATIRALGLDQVEELREIRSRVSNAIQARRKSTVCCRLDDLLDGTGGPCGSARGR